MKSFRDIVIIVVLLIGVLVYFKYFESGTVRVSKVMWDSIQKIMNQPPDTVFRTDTIFPPPDTVIINSKPEPQKVNDSTLFYHDFFKSNDIRISILDTISNKGIIKYREINYSLFVPREVRRTLFIDRPVPVPIYGDHYKYFGSVGIGAGNGLGFAAELGKFNDRKMYSIQYVRAGGNFILFKAGIKF